MKYQQSVIAKLLRQHQERQLEKYSEGGSAGARGARDQVATDTGWDPSTAGTQLGDWGKFMLNQLTTPLETVTGWEFYDPSFSETKFGQTTGKISSVAEGITGLATDVAGTAFLGPAYTAGKAALTAGFDMAGAEDVSSGQTFGALGGPVGKSNYARGGHAGRNSYQNGGPGSFLERAPSLQQGWATPNPQTPYDPVNPPWGFSANPGAGVRPGAPIQNTFPSGPFSTPADAPTQRIPNTLGGMGGIETQELGMENLMNSMTAPPPMEPFSPIANTPLQAQGPNMNQIANQDMTIGGPQQRDLRAQQNQTPNPTEMGAVPAWNMGKVEAMFGNQIRDRQQPNTNIFKRGFENLQGMSATGQTDLIGSLAGKGRIPNDSEGQAAGLGDAFGKLAGPTLAQQTKTETRERNLNELDRPATVYDSHGNIVGDQDPTSQMKKNFMQGRMIGKDTFGKIGSGLKMTGDLFANTMAPTSEWGGLEGMGKAGDFFTADNMKNLSSVAGSFLGKGELGGGVGSSIGNFYGGVNAAFLANRDDGKHLGYGYNSGGQPPKKYDSGDDVKKDPEKEEIKKKEIKVQSPWGGQYMNSRQRKFSDTIMEGKDWDIGQSHNQMTTIPYDPETQMTEYLKAQKLYDDSLNLHGFTLDQLDLEGGVYTPKKGETLNTFKGNREKDLRSGNMLQGGYGLLYGYSDTWNQPLDKSIGDYGVDAINWVKDSFGITDDTIEEKIKGTTGDYINPETINKERYGPKESMYHKTNLEKADKLGLTGEARNKFLTDEYNKTYVEHLKRNSRLTEGDPNFSWAEEVAGEGKFTDFNKTDFSSDLMHKNIYPGATYLSETGFYNPVYAPPVHRPWLTEFPKGDDIVKEDTEEITEEVTEETPVSKEKKIKDYPVHRTTVSGGKIIVPRTYKGQTTGFKGIKKRQAMGGNIRKYGPGATVTRAQLNKERIDSPKTNYIDPNFIDPNFLIHPDLQNIDPRFNMPIDTNLQNIDPGFDIRNNNMFNVPGQRHTGARTDRGIEQRVPSDISGVNNELFLNKLKDVGKYQLNPFLNPGTDYRQGAGVQKEGVTTLPMTPAGALDVPEGFEGYFPIPGGAETSHESGNDVSLITPAEMQGKEEIKVEGGESAEVQGGETFIFPKGKFKRRADKLNKEKDNLIKKISRDEVKKERGKKTFDDIMMASLEKALANNQTAMNALKEEVVETKKAKEQQEAPQEVPQGPMMAQQGMNPPMMAEGAGVVAPGAYLQSYREGRQNTEDWWNRVSTGDLKPTNYYEGILEEPIQHLQDAVTKTLPAAQRKQEANLSAKGNAQAARVGNYVNSANIQDARLRGIYATELDKTSDISNRFNATALQYDTKTANLMAQKDKLEAAGEEKLNKTMLDLFGDYTTAKAEDIDELPAAVGNIIKNEAEAQKNSLLREAMIAGNTGLNVNAYKIDSAGNLIKKTVEELKNEEANKQNNIGSSQISTVKKPPVVSAPVTPIAPKEDWQDPNFPPLTEGTAEGKTLPGVPDQEGLPDPFDDPLYNDFEIPTDEEIISGTSKTPLEREREARGYSPHVTEDDLTITDAMTDFEVESGTTQPILDDQGVPTGEHEAVGIDSYGTPESRKDILEDYMGVAPFTDQYGNQKMGIKGLVPNYDDLDYNIKGILAEYNLNMKWDPRVLIMRATGFDDKTINYHWNTNKAAFEKLWGKHGQEALKRLAKEDKTFTEDVLANLVRERDLVIDGTFDNSEDSDALKAKGMKSPKLYPSTSLRKERWKEGWDPWAI